MDVIQEGMSQVDSLRDCVMRRRLMLLSVLAAVRAGASHSRAMVSWSVSLARPAKPIHLAY